MWHDVAFAERYDATFARKVAPVVAGRLIERAAPRPGEHVLECACGTGACTVLLARALGATARVAASDRSPAMLQIAARKLRVEGSSAAPPALSVQDMQALGLLSGSFDVVVCNLGLHVIPERDAALREAARVLRPGGRAAYTVPGEWSLEPFQTWFWERVGLPDLRPALAAPARSWGREEASESLEADRMLWTALLGGAGFESADARVERATIWFRDGAEFFEVGPFGHTRRALDAISDEAARDVVRRDLTERLDAGATPDGVPIDVAVLCLTGKRGRR